MKKLILLAMLLGMPVTSYLVALGVESGLNGNLRDSLKQNFPKIEQEKIAAITLVRICRDQKIRNKLGDLCSTSDNLELMKTSSFVLGLAAAIFVVSVSLAGFISRQNRVLLLMLFRPGLYLTAGFVIIFVIVNAALLIGCIWYGESALIGRIHIGLMLGIGVGALVASSTVIGACRRTLHRAQTTVIGKKLLETDQPGIWQFVRSIAEKLQAKVPRQIVVGLDPNFYVTQANVICLDGTMKGRTMYLSLPLCRLLTKDELATVIGHELGHFTGEDTKFSLRFFPIYRGATESLAFLSRQHVDSNGKSNGGMALAALPARFILGHFLAEFATAENGISRHRELMADKKATEIGNAKTMASALVKLHAFIPYWQGLLDFMKQTLSSGKSVVNGSALFATFVSKNATPQAFDGLGQKCTVHPTDSHPPLGDRLEALGVSISDVSNAAFVTTPEQPAINLIQNFETLEKELSEVQQVLMVRRGEVRLPETAKEADAKAVS